MMYPAVVVCVMVGVAVLMMIYVVPGLAATFRDVNVELPPLTKAVVAISDFIQNDYIFIIIAREG